MWEKVRLKEICTLFDDGDWIETKHQSESGIRLIQTGNVKTGSFSDRIDKARYISEETFASLKCTEIFCEDILVSRLPKPVGRACIIPPLDERAITAVDCTIIRVQKERVITEFLNYFMQSPSYFSSVQSEVTGATRQRISRKKLGEIPINLPPLTEQKRIVANLDSAFAEIDNAINSYQKRVSELARLQQACLRKNLNDLIEEWDKVFLGDICDLVGGGTPSKNNQEYFDGDIPWATVRDMNCEELFVTEHKITELGLKNSSSKVIPKNNLVIASRVGLGKVCILNQDTAINQDLRGVVPKQGVEIDNRFLFYWFKGIAEHIISEGIGLTVKGVKLPFLKSLSLPMPPLTNQQNFVSKLDIIFGESEIAIKSTEKLIKEHNALKASILSKELQTNII